jgi:phosphotransferase system  glucose/maltose/N-acetylglucosamine-specific IIC component
MQYVGDEIIDLAVAALGSAITAAFAAVLGVVVGMLLGGLFFRLGLYTDEGAAWSGIGLGIPIGTIFAIIAFIYTFRRIRRYGEPK